MELVGYRPEWGRLGPDIEKSVRELMSGAPEGGSAPESATARGWPTTSPALSKAGWT